MLDRGKWEKVIDILDLHKDKEVDGAPVNLYTYILNHKDNIDYPSYRYQGLFVGSGVIESGNKTVLQDRLKRSGMQWNVVTARYILSLKAKEQSRMWKSYVIPFVRYKLLQKTIPGKLPRGKKSRNSWKRRNWKMRLKQRSSVDVRMHDTPLLPSFTNNLYSHPINKKVLDKITSF
ncbi:MAG: hypothetical protein J6A79_00365 [Clostridia bacterium]|nr:hypothetical protein [Clostridia bacterium]